MKILPATPADIGAISAAALADDHACIAPTHFLQNDAGEIRGAFSVGGVTTVFFWSHTSNNKFESLNAVRESQRLARALGKPVVYLCSDTSPFVPLLPDLGFELEGRANCWRLK